MSVDLLDLYRRTGAWTSQIVAGATDLTAATPCEEWTVRDLLNHMLDTQRYFAGSARGEDVSPPGPNPPDLLGNDPAADVERTQTDVISAFSKEGAIDKTGPALGIAFSDLLLHSWDLARATGHDDTMPAGLAEASYDVIHGKFTDEQRKQIFKPEVDVGADASAQDRLLGYTGRTPA
ncbi:MAG TPA: TIGR03086 family metal-binding protein [Mycobacteriales bacterium]|jgi:uncharacterized protein (TIGR03086 family)|nr:TIGR03086 family metal-binding protein [Mycobacteriales bacterium]